MTNQIFPFELSDEDSLIQIDFWFQKDKLTFAVDTGASHTVIDLAPLLIAGYELKDALGVVELETGKGIIEAYIFRIPRITALGITRNNFEICSYDFFNNNIFSTFDGILGLDFIEKEEAETIQLATGIETESMIRVIELYGMQHSMRLHGTESERKRGQIPVKVEDFCKILMIVALGTVSIAGKDNTGRHLLQWQATIDGITYFYTEEVRASELVLKTMYKRKGI